MPDSSTLGYPAVAKTTLYDYLRWRGPASSLPCLCAASRCERPGRGGRPRVGSGAPVADPEPLSARLDRIYAEERVFGLLLALLSGSSVLLAAVGLYGVVAFTVAGRRRELGVRIAVGAGAGHIVRLVLGYAGSIVVAGSVLGVAGGYALSRVMESRLYGVEPADAYSYAAAVAAFAMTAALACWVPTRRAIGVDPVTALRSD